MNKMENTDRSKTRSEQSLPVMHVAPSPHLSDMSMTTKSMMTDVMIALLPVVLMSVFVFRIYALKQLLICIVCSVAAEAVFVKMRNKKSTLNDFSAVVTGIILAMSLPGTAPWYVGCIAAFVAMGIGKVIFGGLGMNIFNPAMVGRAFVMISFASKLAASGYEDMRSTVDVISAATPLNAYKLGGTVTPLGSLFLGTTNGSLGETSALACLIGGIYLCIRKTASWQIPAGILISVVLTGLISDFANPDTGWTVLHHLFSGALMFGAFFIATDPVTSPLTHKGKFLFGLSIGAIVMFLRIFSGYPEGLMFAVLLMNAMTPLINRWTIPAPIGAR